MEKKKWEEKKKMYCTDAKTTYALQRTLIKHSKTLYGTVEKTFYTYSRNNLLTGTLLSYVVNVLCVMHCSI